MRTRQTSRKSITLPGRYFTGLGTPEDVILSDLSVGGCRFALGERDLKMGMPVQLYVANTGPHRATVKWVKDGETGVTFTAPLSDELFASFQASHIPDASNIPSIDDFDDMSSAKPQRFC